MMTVVVAAVVDAVAAAVVVDAVAHLQNIVKGYSANCFCCC